MRNLRSRGFTLMELMIVMSIILSLAGMTIGASRFIQEKGNRDRAKAEIQAMDTALENYKSDNGNYPLSTASISTPNFPNPHVNPKDFSGYLNAATILYQCLSGKTSSNPDDPATNKVYMDFRANQLDPKTKSYVADPWHNAYGYSYTQSSNANGDYYDPNQQQGYNTNFVDLWSTSGVDTKTGLPNIQNKWIANWPN